MSMPPRFVLQKSVGLTLLALALMSGCATQEAVTEQTDPLRRQLDQMQASLNSTAATAQAASALAAANKAREEALSKQLESLQAEFKSLQEGQATLKDGLSKADLRLDELASQARDNAEAVAASQEQLALAADLAERLNKTELRLDEVASQAGENREAAAQAAELAERLARSEQRLDELAGVAKAATDATLVAQQQVAASVQGTAALDGRLSETEKRVNTLAAQVQEALAASKQDYIRQYGKVVSTVKLTEDKTLYPINSPELGAGDRAKLDALAARLKGSQEEYHLDIQGHTDNIGTDDINYALGKARAEVVKRYLHERGGLPLSRMSTISYGATQPGTSGATGNRRIVINLLVLEKK
jgi:outer membrane protein OmpA-like peptidoglycan-associated protein